MFSRFSLFLAYNLTSGPPMRLKVTLTIIVRLAFTFVLASTYIQDGLQGTPNITSGKALALLLVGVFVQQA